MVHGYLTECVCPTVHFLQRLEIIVVATIEVDTFSVPGAITVACALLSVPARDKIGQTLTIDMARVGNDIQVVTHGDLWNVFSDSPLGSTDAPGDLSPVVMSDALSILAISSLPD